MLPRSHALLPAGRTFRVGSLDRSAESKPWGEGHHGQQHSANHHFGGFDSFRRRLLRPRGAGGSYPEKVGLTLGNGFDWSDRFNSANLPVGGDFLVVAKDTAKVAKGIRSMPRPRLRHYYPPLFPFQPWVGGW
jgi:hypothetical protein